MHAKRRTRARWATVAVVATAGLVVTAAAAFAVVARPSGGGRDGSSPFEEALERSDAGPALESRVLRFQTLLAACLSARGYDYEIPTDGATPVAAALPADADEAVVASCAEEALARHGEESAALVARLGSRAAQLDDHPEHRAALARWSACVRGRTGKHFARPDDLEDAASEADAQALSAASDAGARAVEAQGTDIAARERRRRREAARVLERADELPAAVELHRADADCQRTSGLAEVRADLVSGLVSDLDDDVSGARRATEDVAP